MGSVQSQVTKPEVNDEKEEADSYDGEPHQEIVHKFAELKSSGEQQHKRTASTSLVQSASSKPPLRLRNKLEDNQRPSLDNV